MGGGVRGCVEIGKEFDFGILINIAFTIQLNVASLQRTHMLPHVAWQAGTAIMAGKLEHLLSATNTHSAKSLSSDYRRHLAACGCTKCVHSVGKLPEKIAERQLYLKI